MSGLRRRSKIQKKGKYSWGLILSVALHGLILLMFILSLNFSSDDEQHVTPEPEIVNAKVVDQSKIEAAAKKLKQKEEDKRLKQINKQKKLEEQRQAEENKLTELKRKRQEEEKLAKEQAQSQREQAEKETKRLAEIKAKQKIEEQKVAALKKQQQEVEKKRQQKERIEAERKAKVAEAQRKEEAKRKAAQQARQKVFADEKRREVEERRLSAQLENAKNDMMAAQQLIQRKINRSWRRPIGVGDGLSCVLRIKLFPNGRVKEVTVARSSGNKAFDQSGEIAVRKASPFPLPDNPMALKEMLDINLTFKPS